MKTSGRAWKIGAILALMLVRERILRFYILSNIVLVKFVKLHHIECKKKKDYYLGRTGEDRGVSQGERLEYQRNLLGREKVFIFVSSKVIEYEQRRRNKASGASKVPL